MAHVLLWYDDGVVREIVRLIAEEELGYTVTTATSFWEALAALRSSLHPLVVVYDGCDHYHLAPEEVEALSAQRVALRQHQYVATSACSPPLPPRVQDVVADLGMEWLYMPYELTTLIGAIERAVARLAEQAGA
jgi:CheY-like chemotaxis protein